MFLSLKLLNVDSQSCIWAKESYGNNYDDGSSVCTDTLGNVYIVGSFESSSIMFGSYTLSNMGNVNPFLVKYSPNGAVLWARCGQGIYAKPFSVTTDKYGNIFTCGNFNSAMSFSSYALSNSGNTDYYIVKYDPNGNVIWAQKGGGEGTENLYSVACDSEGNVYTVGYSTSSVVTIGSYTFTNSQSGLLVVKYYGSSGNVAWAQSGIGDASAYAAHLDKGNNLYITGEFYSSAFSIGTQTLTRMDNDPDFFVFKLDTSGNALWAKSGSNEYGYSITSNQFGDVFVFGNYYSPTLTIGTYTLQNSDTNNNYDSFLVKYGADGDIRWARSYGNPGQNFGYSVASDLSNVYIIGNFLPYSNLVIGSYTLNVLPPYYSIPLYLIRLDFNGSVAYARALRCGGGGGNGNNQSWICEDKYKNTYICADFDQSPFTIDTQTLTCQAYSNVFLAKFHFDDVGIKENTKDNQQTVLYPNPAGSVFTIKLRDGKQEEKLEIAIFDITGRLLWTEKRAGGTEFQLKNDLQNGMYLVKVKFEDGTYDIHHLIISK